MSGDYFLENSGQLVMPFYLICDVSFSMRDEMRALHDGVTRLWEAIEREPVLDDVARVSVMTFSDDAKVPVRLTQVSDCPGLPKFTPEGLTYYGAAFRKLAEEMRQDYAALRREHWNVYRPCAYFLTDGEPTDRDWRQTFADTLTESPTTREKLPAYPIFVPFGFRDAQAQTLLRLAYPPGVSKSYHTRTARIEQALEGLLDIIMKSVVRSGRSVLSGEPEHVLPDPGYGSGITCRVAGYDPGT